MTKHYHRVMETPDGNLSQGMRHLNGVYTQWFNRRHQRVGHVFQGRYKAILMDKDNYLLELSRYRVFNPVRAGRNRALHWFPCYTDLCAALSRGTPPMANTSVNYAWQALVSGSVDVVTVPGSHLTLLDPDHVETLGQALETRLFLI